MKIFQENMLRLQVKSIKKSCFKNDAKLQKEITLPNDLPVLKHHKKEKQKRG